MAFYFAHDKDSYVKEEMLRWDVDDDTIVEFVAIHEKASRVSADN